MVRAVELPMFRMQTLQYLEASSTSLPSHAPDGLSTDLPEKMRGWLIEGASSGDLFYVSAEMTSLAKAAALTLPDFELQDFDFACPSGYMIFDAPVIRMRDDGRVDADAPEIIGMIWHLVAQEGLAAVGYLTREQGRVLCQAVGFIIVGEHARNSQPDWMSEAHGQVQGVLKATWLLMRQPLSTEEPASFDRAARRRMQRADAPPRPVRVIKLRRAAGSIGTDPGRDYHHQWIVRGHWRQHWYPKEQVHRPLWIAPHVKGPEGAPFIAGEKVQAWTR